MEAGEDRGFYPRAGSESSSPIAEASGDPSKWFEVRWWRAFIFFCFSINKVTDCGWKVPPVVSVNKGCCSHQTFSLQSPWQWTPRERGCPQWNISYPPPKGAPEETGGESRDAGPSQLRYISKEWFQGTQTLAPFHTDESTKFLNLRCLVFFNQQWSLHVCLPGLCCKTSIYPGSALIS